MKKYAVGYINFSDNELTIEIVEAPNIYEAVKKHSQLQEDSLQKWISEMPQELQDIKEEFFNGDAMIDVKEIE